MINKKSALRGAKTVAPLMLGILPFALIAGITASNTGLSIGMSILMNIGIFSGAAQLTILQLIALNAHTLVIIFTSLIISLRMMLYSLSIAPYLQNISTKYKALLAYGLSDQSYAMSLIQFINNPEENTHSFFFGASFTIWVVWQVFSIVGYLMGSIIPPELGLDFAIPLTFIVVLLKGVAGYPGVISIISSAAVAVLASNFPMNLGLVLAAIIGIAAGSISEKLFKKKSEVWKDE